jgi:hypothetical protein
VKGWQTLELDLPVRNADSGAMRIRRLRPLFRSVTGALLLALLAGCSADNYVTFMRHNVSAMVEALRWRRGQGTQ